MRKKGMAWIVLFTMLMTMFSAMSVTVHAEAEAGVLSWDFETENHVSNMITSSRSASDKTAIDIDTFTGGGWSRLDPGYGRYYVYGSPHRIKYSMIGGGVWDVASSTKDTKTFGYSDASCQVGSKKANRTPESVKTSGDAENNYCVVVINTPNEANNNNYYINGMAIQLTDDQLIPGREYVLTADVLSCSYKVPDSEATDDTLMMEGGAYYQDLERYVWTGVGKPSARQKEFKSSIVVKPGWALNDATGTGKVVDTDRANGKASGHEWSKIQTTVKADAKFYENGAVTFYIGMSTFDEAGMKLASAPASLAAEKVYFDNIKLTPVTAADGIAYNRVSVGKHWDFEEKSGSAEYTEGDSGYEWLRLKPLGEGSTTEDAAETPKGVEVVEKQSAKWGEGYGLSYGTSAWSSQNCLTVGTANRNTIAGIRYLMNPEEWTPGTYSLTLYAGVGAGIGNDTDKGIELHAALFQGDTELNYKFGGGGSTTYAELHEEIKKQFTENSTENLLADYKIGDLGEFWGYYSAEIELTQEMLKNETLTLVLYARARNWDTATQATDAEAQGFLYWKNPDLYFDEISLLNKSTALGENQKASICQKLVSEKSIDDVVSLVGMFDADNNGSVQSCTIQTGTVSGVSHRNLLLNVGNTASWPYWKMFTWNSAMKPLYGILEGE